MLPTPGSDIKFQIVQLLNIQAKIVLVPTYSNKDSSKKYWNVQPMTTWNAHLKTTASQELDAFLTGEPAKFDFIQYLVEQQPQRTEMRLWKVGVSDYKDMVNLHSPYALVPMTPLQSPKASVLSLTDALDNIDFIAVAQKVSHWKKGGHFYDARDVQSKRTYLQAVLMCDFLYQHGQHQFDSGRSQAYYAAIMRKPGCVDAKATAKQCRDLLALEDGEAPPVLPALPLPSRPKRPAVLDIDGDEGDDGAPPPKRPALTDAAIDGDEGDAKSSSSSSSDTSGESGKASSCSVCGDSSGDDGPEIPSTILGQRARLEVKASGDRGIRITCPTHGGRCRSFRSLSKDMGRYGPRSAEIFLKTWITAATERGMAFDDHKSHRPNKEEVKSYCNRWTAN
jgi:hypothetical protein